MTTRPEALPSVERRRLSRQCRRIVDRLREGPASNEELSRIALKYTSRISEIRQAGYAVDVVARDHETGVCWYELRVPETQPRLWK